MSTDQLIVPDHLQQNHRYVLPGAASEESASFIALPEKDKLDEMFQAVFPKLAMVPRTIAGVPALLASGTTLLWCFAAEAKDRILEKLTKFDQRLAQLESRIQTLEKLQSGQPNDG